MFTFDQPFKKHRLFLFSQKTIRNKNNQNQRVPLLDFSKPANHPQAPATAPLFLVRMFQVFSYPTFF